MALLHEVLPSEDRVLARARGIEVEFAVGAGWRKAVLGVDLAVRSGEILGVVGESGSGKSASALSLARLLAPGGRLRVKEMCFAGRDVTNDLKAWRDLRGREIGVVFQDPLACLNPAFTIGRQLTEILRYHQALGARMAHERAGDLLTQLMIPASGRVLAAYPHELSGGLRQRAMIAMALAGAPRLLIADEPTTALDVTVQARILILLRDLVERKQLALLLISHDFAVVAALADRILVMLAGRVIEEGPLDRIVEAPRHPYTAELVALAQGKAVVTHGSGASGLRDLPGCAYAHRCTHVQERCRTQSPEASWHGDRMVSCHFPL